MPITTRKSGNRKINMTENTTASGAADTIFQAMADRAYCNYIEQLRRDECLGWEHKAKTGKFGEVELKAHKKAAEYLGAHRAFSEAAKLIAASAPVAPTPPESLHTFLNAAAAEGYVLNGVDAADLYVELFPERYVAALERFHSGMHEATPEAAPVAPAPHPDLRVQVMEIITGVWDHDTQIDDATDDVLDLAAAPKAAPASNESAYQRGYMDGMAKSRRDAGAAPQQEAQEPVASVHRDTLAMLNSGQVRPWDGGARLHPPSKARFDTAYAPLYAAPPTAPADRIDLHQALTEPVAWLVYLPSIDTQHVYDSQDDMGYLDDLTNHADAEVIPLYPGTAPKDAERWRWLTFDHVDANTRNRVRELIVRLPVMSYSAACADIDAARAQAKEGGAA